MNMRNDGLHIYSTCPPWTGEGGYLERVAEAAGWSEAAGCRGMLVYTDNGIVDPWLVAQAIVERTQSLEPLVAVQPVYMHPFTVARMVATLGHLHGRRVALNMVSGGFRNDLTCLGDPTPHDERYERLVEYTSLVKRLLAGERVTHSGRYYRVEQLRLSPELAPRSEPDVFVAGSSEAGVEAARRIGAIAVRYPRPAGEEDLGAAGTRVGIRVSIIARASEEEAWTVAHALYPPDRRGELTRQMATKVSDSVWHAELAARPSRAAGSPYWLVPFQTYRTNCPCLVGSYETVGEELGRYVAQGARAFILDVPRCADDLRHARAAFDAVLAGAVS